MTGRNHVVPLVSVVERMCFTQRRKGLPRRRPGSAKAAKFADQKDGLRWWEAHRVKERERGAATTPDPASLTGKILHCKGDWVTSLQGSREPANKPKADSGIVAKDHTARQLLCVFSK